MGKMETTYDRLLMIRVQDKSDEQIKASIYKIITSMIILLVQEMEVGEGMCRFIPSSSYLAKKIQWENVLTIL